MHVMKKFIGYYKPYKKIFFIDMFCAMMISLIDLAFPQILNYLNDTLYLDTKEAILNSLLYLFIGLLIMYIVRAVCRFYVSGQGHIMGARMESDMRQDLFDHYEMLSFSYYDKNNTGEMMSRLVSDLFDISEFAHHGPENLFISLLKIVGSFILLSFIHIPLTLILLAVTLVMLVFSYYQNKRMQATFTDNRRKIAGVNASLQDSLAGIRVVKSFANEDLEREKFYQSNDRFLKSKENNYNIMGIFYGGNNFFQGLLYLVILVAGGYFVAMGTLDPVSLATYALYINIFVAPIEILVEFTEMFQKGFSGFKRFLEVIETEPEIVDRPDAKELKDVKGVIDYQDVSFAYTDEEPVLNHVNIHIEAGKSVALVGPSGGGKQPFAAYCLASMMSAMAVFPLMARIFVTLHYIAYAAVSVLFNKMSIYLPDRFVIILPMVSQLPVMRKLSKQLRKQISMTSSRHCLMDMIRMSESVVHVYPVGRSSVYPLLVYS